MRRRPKTDPDAVPDTVRSPGPAPKALTPGHVRVLSDVEELLKMARALEKRTGRVRYSQAATPERALISYLHSVLWSALSVYDDAVENGCRLEVKVWGTDGPVPTRVPELRRLATIIDFSEHLRARRAG